MWGHLIHVECRSTLSNTVSSLSEVSVPPSRNCYFACGPKEVVLELVFTTTLPSVKGRDDEAEINNREITVHLVNTLSPEFKIHAPYTCVMPLRSCLRKLISKKRMSWQEDVVQNGAARKACYVSGLSFLYLKAGSPLHGGLILIFILFIRQVPLILRTALAFLFLLC